MSILLLLALLYCAGAVLWGTLLRLDAERRRDIGATITAFRRPPNPSSPERH